MSTRGSGAAMRQLTEFKGFVDPFLRFDSYEQFLHFFHTPASRPRTQGILSFDEPNIKFDAIFCIIRPTHMVNGANHLLLSRSFGESCGLSILFGPNRSAAPANATITIDRIIICPAPPFCSLVSLITNSF